VKQEDHDDRTASIAYTGVGILDGDHPRRPSGPDSAPSQRQIRGIPISYTSALLAVLAGIVHAGLSPVMVVAGVRPNLALVAVVLVTCVVSFEAGVLWAFIAGVVANLMIPEPLGSIPLALLAVAAVAGGTQRTIGRLVWVAPVVAAFLASVAADVVALTVARLVGEPLTSGVPFELILPAAALNAALAGVLIYPVRLIATRIGLLEPAPW
jgi:rod shape-determining protein MreD